MSLKPRVLIVATLIGWYLVMVGLIDLCGRGSVLRNFLGFTEYVGKGCLSTLRGSIIIVGSSVSLKFLLYKRVSRLFKFSDRWGLLWRRVKYYRDYSMEFWGYVDDVTEHGFYLLMDALHCGAFMKYSKSEKSLTTVRLISDMWFANFITSNLNFKLFNF